MTFAEFHDALNDELRSHGAVVLGVVHQAQLWYERGVTPSQAALEIIYAEWLSDAEDARSY